MAIVLLLKLTMQRKIIIFDFDGVIVDTFSLSFNITNSREYITMEEYKGRFEGNIYDSKPRFKENASTMDGFFTYYEPQLMKCRPVQGITDVIKSLSEKYDLIIVSSTISPIIASYLESVNLASYFKEILGSDVDRSKVVKINRILKDYSINPTDIIFITDTLGDIREGKHCDVDSIAVTWGYHQADVLEKGSPFAVVKNPTEILEYIEKYF